MGQFHDLGIYKLCYVPPPQDKLGLFVYYSYIHVELGNLGGVILPVLCARSVIHLMTTRKKHYSSQCYSFNILLIATMSLKIPKLFTTFLLFNLTLFFNHIGVNFFLFSKFLTMKIKPWRHMSNATCRMEHIHVVE